MADAAPAAPVAPPNAPSSVPVIAPNALVATKPGAPAAALAEAPAAKAEEIFTVTVDGQQQKYTRAQAERMLSKAGYADKVIRQAREVIRQAQQEKAQREKEPNDPAELLRLRGHDPEAYARSVLERKIEEAKLSPEQRRIAELEQTNAQAQEKIKAAETEKNEGAVKAQAAALQQRMETELAAAAERVGLPRDADGFYAVYKAVQEMHELGLPFDAQHACEMALESINGAFKGLESSVLKGLKGKALADRLGKSVVDEILRYKVEEIRGGGVKPAGSPQAETPKQEPKRWLTQRELDAKLHEMNR